MIITLKHSHSFFPLPLRCITLPCNTSTTTLSRSFKPPSVLSLSVSRSAGLHGCSASLTNNNFVWFITKIYEAISHFSGSISCYFSHCGPRFRGIKVERRSILEAKMLSNVDKCLACPWGLTRSALELFSLLQFESIQYILMFYVDIDPHAALEFLYCMSRSALAAGG